MAIAASGGSQLHLRVEPGLKSRRHQPEQLLADVLPDPGRSERPVVGLEGRELGGYSRPRRPALQPRGFAWLNPGPDAAYSPRRSE